jgi:hypothetical protein
MLSGHIGRYPRTAFLARETRVRASDCTSKWRVIWDAPGLARARAPRLSSGFEAENRCVQRLGSAHRIKIFS